MPKPSDADWDALIRSVAARLPVHTPDWTDPAGNDPGMTIVEVFAFLGESLLARPDLSPQARSRVGEVVARLGRAEGMDCRDATLTRSRFVTGTLLTADDLAQEQDYHRAKQRRHNRLVHGVGVVTGLEVDVEAPAGGAPAIVVSPGVAIAPDGEELVVCEPATADLCQDVETCYVSVRAVERATHAGPNGEHGRVEESAAVDASGAVAPDALAIARLHRRDGTWRVDTSFTAARVR